MIKVGIVSLIFVTGCQSTIIKNETLPAQPIDTVSPVLEQAMLDVEQIINQGTLWRVRDSVTNGKTINLDELLEIAKIMQRKGNIEKASRLARKVSKLANLALQQHSDNHNALPVFIDFNWQE